MRPQPVLYAVTLKAYILQENWDKIPFYPQPQTFTLGFSNRNGTILGIMFTFAARTKT